MIRLSRLRVVVVVMVPHCVLKGVKDGKSISQKSKGGDVAKPL